MVGKLEAREGAHGHQQRREGALAEVHQYSLEVCDVKNYTATVTDLFIVLSDYGKWGCGIFPWFRSLASLFC